MNTEVISYLEYLMREEWGNAFNVYANILSIALPIMFTFAACNLLVNLVFTAFTKGKIRWFGGGK